MMEYLRINRQRQLQFGITSEYIESTEYIHYSFFIIHSLVRQPPEGFQYECYTHGEHAGQPHAA